MMEQETDELLKHSDSIKANYGDDVLNLIAATKYVERLLANTRVRRYLAKHHEDALTAIEQLISDNTADKQRRPVGHPLASPHQVPQSEGDRQGSPPLNGATTAASRKVGRTRSPLPRP